MTTEVFIETYQLDVSADISTLLNFAVDDIKDFASRNTNFSKTIVFPGTSNNNKIFGNVFNLIISNPYNPGSNNVGINFNPSVGANCMIFQDQIQVFKGTLRILEIVIDKGVPEYECAVFGELGGLVASIGKNRLQDLDFSAYDHTLNVTNIQNSWDNTPGSGYFYPLIDYGAVSQNKIDYDITTFRPALYAKEYIDKIFENADYRYSSALFETSRFKSLIIPHNQKYLRGFESELMRAERTASYEIIDTEGGGVPSEDYVKYETFTGNGFSANGDKSIFTYNDAATINIVITFHLTGTFFITTRRDIILQFRHNNVEVPAYSENLGLYPDGSWIWSRSFNLTLNQNDTISHYFDGDSSGTSFSVNVAASYFTVTSNVPIFTPLTNGDSVLMQYAIPPNVLQVDFLRSIIKLFNLYVYESNQEVKKVLIEPYVDFFDLDISDARDWTDKIDRNKAIRVKPMSELNSRFYDFKFKQDSDYYNELYRKTYNESYGDRLYDSAFQFTNERSSVELIFSPTVLVGYQGVDKIVSAMYKKNAAVEEKTDTNIRILQSKKVTGVAAWDIELNGVDLASNLTAYGYAGHYDDPDAPANDIHFGVPKELYFALVAGAVNVTQFNVYWSPYMAEITDKDSKLLTGHFRLSNKDIFDLDFSKFIYLDGGYWRLNKIEDWNASRPETCKVELLKVINKIY